MVAATATATATTTLKVANSERGLVLAMETALGLKWAFVMAEPLARARAQGLVGLLATALATALELATATGTA